MKRELKMFPVIVTLFCMSAVVVIMVFGNQPGSFPQHIRFDGSMLPSEVQKGHNFRQAERILMAVKAREGLTEGSDCLQSSGKLGLNSCTAQKSSIHETEKYKINNGNEVETEKKKANLQENTYFKEIIQTMTQQENAKIKSGGKFRIFNSENEAKTKAKADESIAEILRQKMMEEIREIEKNKNINSQKVENEKKPKTDKSHEIDEEGKKQEGLVEEEGEIRQEVKHEGIVEKEGGKVEALVQNEGENKEGLVEKKAIVSQEDLDGAGGSAMDKACVSVWPSLCKFVDELEMPPLIDGTTGEVITLGVYKITQKFHRDLPHTALYGFGPNPKQATSPGPTIAAMRYIPTHIQWENHIEDDRYYTSTKLPTSQAASPKYGGIPIVIHLHGGETEPASDGHPEAWFTRKGETGATFQKSLYTYHNQQPSSTMWFHDHTEGLTALGIYHGMTGFYHLTDPADRSLNLPSGKYDLSLNIQNKVISENGYLHTSDHQDVINFEVRDLLVVNGKAWPYTHVDQAKYRLRFLNGCNLRLLNMSFLYTLETQTPESSQLNLLLPAGTPITFHQIASDGGFLNAPVPLEYIELAPAERAEIVVDFTGYQGEVWFVNSDDVNVGPDGAYNHDLNLGALVKFFVGSTVVSSPPIASVLNSIPEPNIFAAQRTRWLHIWEIPVDKADMEGEDVIDGTLHLLNNKRYSENATEVLELGTTEIWNILNLTPQTHTIHLHAVKFRLLSRQSFAAEDWEAGLCRFPDSNDDSTLPSCFGDTVRPATAGEAGWKDTFLTTEHEVTKILVSASNQDGEDLPFDATAAPGYVWHCHMAEHEDYEMMRPFRFVKATLGHKGATNTR